MNIDDIIRQSQDGVTASKDQLLRMLELQPYAPETYRIMAEARRVSTELTGNRAEVHAQLALNLAPCPANCGFCSFAQVNGIFTDSIVIDPELAVEYATRLEADGANAVYVMVTANYDFSQLLEMAREIKSHLRPETVLVGNVGDQSYKRAVMMKDAGFGGVYHSLRLREGIDTSLKPENRVLSLRNFMEAGLSVGTCVEPVGPEHTNEEIAEMILFTSSFAPAYSGAGRRITVPGGVIAGRGMISELRMAQLVAITRLGMTRETKGNCTHEPYSLGAAAGACLFWAEVGANPRDTTEKTEEGRGFTVTRCRDIFTDADLGLLEGPSVYYSRKPAVGDFPLAASGD